MKYGLLLIFILLMACKNEHKKNEPTVTTSEIKAPLEKTTYYLIRHAEKELADSSNNNPILTEKGLERAGEWAKFFSDKDLDMVYGTKYIRTIQTVIPTLDKTKLQLNLYEPNNLYSPEFLEKTSGKKVLIVGHQSSIPNLANKLLEEQKFKKIAADVYDNLYIVVYETDGTKTGKLETKNF